MICIKVSREELRKISCGKEGKIKVKQYRVRRRMARNL